MMAAYVRPVALDEALAAAGAGARIAAGCTDLFPITAAQSLEIGADRPILDVTAVPELRGVSLESDDAVRIGATTTWSEIAACDWLPPAFDGLRMAAREVGGAQIQNAGTIAGNLCTASPAADGAPPLLTLDAEVELRSLANSRRLPLSAFLIGPRRTALADDELVAAVVVPPAPQRGVSTFEKLGARRYLVISIAMVAARLAVVGGRVEEAAIAVGACGPTAVRLPAVEAALRGADADPCVERFVRRTDVAAALSPISDIRADVDHRIEAATELARRVVADLVRLSAADGSREERRP